MRAATQTDDFYLHSEEISIHAAHAGSDYAADFRQASAQAISIHAAHAGSDMPPTLDRQAHKRFQSTLPMRAATEVEDGILYLG